MSYFPTIKLLKNLDYTHLLKTLSGMPIEEQIKVYQDIYDAEIDFEQYFYQRIPNRDHVRSGPCPLHDEDVTGSSFSIDVSRNMWQCFGKCKTVGRAVQFELLYERKFNPTLSRLSAIRNLHKMFPTLPEPIIFETNEMISAMDRGYINLNIKNLQPKQIDLLQPTDDLSVKMLQAILIDKNLNKTYR